VILDGVDMSSSLKQSEDIGTNSRSESFSGTSSISVTLQVIILHRLVFGLFCLEESTFVYKGDAASEGDNVQGRRRIGDIADATPTSCEISIVGTQMAGCKIRNILGSSMSRSESKN